MSRVTEGYTPTILAASGLVFTGPGCLAGFLCTTAGTLLVYDAVTATNAITEAFDVAEGSFYNIPALMQTGCYMALGGGAKGTAFWTA